MSQSLISNSNELEERLKQMEEDQEEMNSNLIQLTSHFAKVQLRLQQVVSAPPENRENLLKELEQFAFRGVPNLTSPRIPEDLHKPTPSATNADKMPTEEEVDSNTDTNDALLESQRKKHAELIHQLKDQLQELESYAYESGEGNMPSNVLLERQRVVMEQLKARLNLNMDNIDKLSEEELKAQVDSAVGQIVNPLKMKSQLVEQLQTQITDLEMFIEFLQNEASTIVPADCNGCGCSKHNSPTTSPSKSSDTSGAKSHSHHKHHKMTKCRMRTPAEQEAIRKQTNSILEKTIAVLQLTALAQFGCGSEHFYKNSLKNTTKGNHYGDLRARLEMAVDHILEACSRIECITDTDCTTTSTSSTASEDGSDQPEFLMNSPLVTTIIRRELAIAIRDLMQHGMISTGGRPSLIPFMGCMSARSRGQPKASASASASGGSSSSTYHAWDVILKYYKMKGGPEYNAAPARKLSQSFGLDLAGTTQNNRQSLLSAINHILNSHEPYKRSQDAMLKAFVCAGLNKRKLIPWLRLILKNQTILETFYTSWSYVVKTGFDDAFRAIERLSMYVFDIPEDTAVKQFKDMNEAF